jgi:three-Cys-motif partner protein
MQPSVGIHAKRTTYNSKTHLIMAKDINNEAFDEATKTKLEIFGDSFKEWFPVFLHDRYTEKIVIFDFFAGSGTDANGEHGSPLTLLKNAKGDGSRYCKIARDKSVHFIFNESLKHKSEALVENIRNYISHCQDNSGCDACVYDYEVKQEEFLNLFNKPNVQKILNNKKIGKFLLLDQYGFKQINNATFKQLTNYPKTDFVFFISSSNIKRFKEHENVRRYLETENLDFDETEPKECHRVIAKYFKKLAGEEYYVHHFTIRKGRNYWGLIFCTAHSYGMEKFLKTCWKHDVSSGEANFNINNDLGGLFAGLEPPKKKVEIEEKVKEQILNGRIRNNIDGFEYVMQNGCEPKLFTEVVKKLEREGSIIRKGNLNYSSTNIHRLPKGKIYEINVK